MISYSLLKTSGKARRGKITTPHGEIETPVFMPVGTAGTVKSLTSNQIAETGSQIVLANTYHLYLRPGMDVIGKFGGIHHFMHWDKPILTDSGGFQVFSLSGGLTKVTDEGVLFKSHIDGSMHHISPEISMQIQHVLGSDIIMAFDEPIKDDAPYQYAIESSQRTIRWLDRCIKEWHTLDPERKQSLFGIVQGGIYRDLRLESIHKTLDANLEGIAIGGETIGYNKERTKEILDWILDEIPCNLPRYTMGVGDIDDIFEVVARGVDMFDCVSPTRLARNGALLISPAEGGNKKNKYRLGISKAEYAMQDIPIDRTCQCYTCTNYSRGYLCHLFRSHELLANTLASIHNVAMLAQVCEKIRGSIENDTFASLMKEWIG